jgi:hypothetical protein
MLAQNVTELAHSQALGGILRIRLHHFWANSLCILDRNQVLQCDCGVALSQTHSIGQNNIFERGRHAVQPEIVFPLSSESV